VGERLTDSKYDRIRSVKLNLLRFPNGKPKAEAIEITIACERYSETKLPDGRWGTESTAFMWIVGVSQTSKGSSRYFKILSDVSSLTDTDGIANIQPYLPSN
jgi:hypothetical protein